jgi:hypothetical protein
MLGKIIEVYKGDVITNTSIIVIPQLKDLPKEYYTHLWALFDPESPYFNYEEHEREEKIQEDIPVNQNDPKFVAAYNKCKEMYDSPIRKLLRGAKAGIEKLSQYLETTTVTSGRDGNITQVINAAKDLPRLIQAYQATEQAYRLEVQKSRGQMLIGYDELDD